jgi:hypothetical protein
MSDKSVPYTRFFENDKDDAVPSSSSYEEIYTPGAAAAVLTGQAAQRAIPMRMQDQDDDHPYKSVIDKNAVRIRRFIDDYKQIFKFGNQEELTGNAVEIAKNLSHLFREKLTEKEFKDIVEAVGKYYIPYRDRNRLQSQASTTAVLAGQGAAAVAAAPPTVPSPAGSSVGAVGTAIRLPPASLSVGAVGTNVRPERRSVLSLMKSFSPSPVEEILMQRINPRTTMGLRNLTRRMQQGLLTYEREPTTSLAMMTKLLGRNNLARKLMVNLALDVRRPPVNQKVQQILNHIERRVDGPKEREARLPRITMNELHAYAIGTVFDPNAFHQPLPEYMPPQFPTVVQPLQPFTEASCLTTKKQLQQQRDELIKILKEKHAMLFNLQRIHFASIDETNLRHATEWDRSDERRGGEQGMRFRSWEHHLEIAEQKSIEAITTLTEQIKELRERIAKINKPSCTMLGGSKTKSKYTKSKKTKRRNRKYSKRN